MPSDVVITGRGLVTPIGFGLEANLNALKSGKSGICRFDEWKDLNLESQVLGKVDMNFDCPAFDRKQRRFMPNNAVMAVAAAYEAILEAGYTKETLPGDRMAVITGCGGSSYRDFSEAVDVFARTGSARKISPFAIPRIMPSSAASNLSLIYKIKGESYDISCACASGGVAIAQAVKMIQSGEYDIVMTGGCEEAHWTQCIGFIAMRALSHSYNETPEKSSRPFDKGRDGFVIGEAAGMMILESAEHAAKRGAKPICRLSGSCINSNATDMVVPNREAIADVMKNALKSANLTPHDIDYINAHATSTGVGDPLELQGIYDVFESAGSHPMINSTKSQTGHTIGAAGAIELIFSTQMMEHSFVSGTVNLENPDDGMEWADIVKETRLDVPIRHILSNSFGFGGTNVALIASRCDA